AALCHPGDTRRLPSCGSPAWAHSAPRSPGSADPVEMPAARIGDVCRRSQCHPRLVLLRALIPPPHAPGVLAFDEAQIVSIGKVTSHTYIGVASGHARNR